MILIVKMLASKQITSPGNGCGIYWISLDIRRGHNLKCAVPSFRYVS